MSVILTHPAAPAGGTIWLDGTRIIDLPTPPDRPFLHLEAFPVLVSAVGVDASCTLLQLVARCEHEPHLGWLVYGGTNLVRSWNGWGKDRTRNALQELARVGAIRREQLLITTVHGDSRRGAGLILLQSTTAPPNEAEPTTVPVGARSSAPAPTVPPAPLRRVPDGGAWGVPLTTDEIRSVLTVWGYDKIDEALSAFGQIQVSDAIKATAYRLLKGRKMQNPGGYARTMLTSGDIAGPPDGLPAEWLTGEIDLVALVPPVNPADALEVARAALDTRAAAIWSRWKSLAPSDRDELEAEFTELANTLTLLSPAERQRRETDLREALMAERGLLASLPDDSDGTDA